MLDVYVKFFQAHEKVIITLVLAFALFGGIERVDSIVVKHDKAVSSAQAVVVAADVAKNAAVAQQLQADTLAMKQMQAASDAKQAVLQAEVVDLISKLAGQQKQDAAMTPNELTARWDVLVPNAGVFISNGQITLPEAGAIATVQQLEEVPIQAQELTATQAELVDVNGLLTQSQKVNADYSAQVTGLNKTAVDNAAKCEDDKKVIKAEARKSKWRWFWIGVVTGFIGRQEIK